MPLGTIVSAENAPSTTQFAFLVRDRAARVSEYVEVRSGERRTMGVVTGMHAGNRYFERPESVAAYDDVNAAFPTKEWEYAVAECAVLGDYDGKVLRRTTFPPLPGATVERAKDADVQALLHLDPNGLELGELAAHRVPARVNATRLLQKHVALLGVSGSGKSNLAAVLVEEILEKNKGLCVVALDVHGDYTGFAKTYQKQTTVVDAATIRFSARATPLALLYDALDPLSDVQKRALEAAHAKVRKAGNAFSVKDVADAVRETNGTAASKGALRAWLLSLHRKRVLAAADAPAWPVTLAPNHLVVIDFSNVESQGKKRLVAALLARKLFRLRKDGKVPPFVLLVEEAHQFAPQQTQKHHGAAKRAIETLAREGRKFGACVCLVSQRPVQLSTTALSQCNTFAVLRITNPLDVDHIARSAEGITTAVQAQLPGLPVGEAVVFGEALGFPAFVRVRPRKSAASGKGKPLEELAREFAENNATARNAKRDAADAFA